MVEAGNDGQGGNGFAIPNYEMKTDPADIFTGNNSASPWMIEIEQDPAIL